MSKTVCDKNILTTGIVSDKNVKNCYQI